MIEPKLYRKKPVVIQAHQLHGDMLDILKVFPELASCRFVDGNIEIKTLEGTMTASNGDWIIKGIKGEFYPCKPDIFEATYEPCMHKGPSGVGAKKKR